MKEREGQTKPMKEKKKSCLCVCMEYASHKPNINKSKSKSKSKQKKKKKKYFWRLKSINKYNTLFFFFSRSTKPPFLPSLSPLTINHVY